MPATVTATSSGRVTVSASPSSDSSTPSGTLDGDWHLHPLMKKARLIYAGFFPAQAQQDELLAVVQRQLESGYPHDIIDELLAVDLDELRTRGPDAAIDLLQAAVRQNQMARFEREQLGGPLHLGQVELLRCSDYQPPLRAAA